MNSYQNRYVAFIDILGFKELVKKSEEDPDILNRLHKVLQMASEFKEFQAIATQDNKGLQLPHDFFRLTTFSDSVLMSASADKIGLNFLTVMVTMLSNLLLNQGVFIRGGICKGKLIHDDKMVLGKGLIEAYNLESTTAIYPRIIVDTQIVEDVEFVGYKTHGRFRQDFDGLWHLHVFNPGFLQLGVSLMKAKGYAEKSFMSLGRQEIIDSIKRAESLSVKSKVTWLARYFNEYANVIGLELIPLQ